MNSADRVMRFVTALICITVVVVVVLITSTAPTSAIPFLIFYAMLQSMISPAWVLVSRPVLSLVVLFAGYIGLLVYLEHRFPKAPRGLRITMVLGILAATYFCSAFLIIFLAMLYGHNLLDLHWRI
jgi:hypothetical protein